MIPLSDVAAGAAHGHFLVWAWRDGALLPREEPPMLPAAEQEIIELAKKHGAFLPGRALAEHDNHPNIIVDLAKEEQARLLGGDTTNRSITKIGVGIGTGAAAPGNTSLTSAFTRVITGVTYPTAGQVRFAFTIGSGEANGLAITEFGLFTAGDVLFARRVRAGAINKASDLTLTGTWTITY